MTVPGNGSLARDLAERMLLGGVGVVALTAERVDSLVDALVARGGMQRDQARSVVEDVAARWRADTRRFGGSGSSAQRALRELGLVTRGELEELELRLAQLEHRLRLLEAEPKPRL